ELRHARRIGKVPAEQHQLHDVLRLDLYRGRVHVRDRELKFDLQATEIADPTAESSGRRVLPASMHSSKLGESTNEFAELGRPRGGRGNARDPGRMLGKGARGLRTRVGDGHPQR